MWQSDRGDFALKTDDNTVLYVFDQYYAIKMHNYEKITATWSIWVHLFTA